MPVFKHPDYAALRDELVLEHVLLGWSDCSETWRAPWGGLLVVDLPASDPYEYVEVQVDSGFPQGYLENLGFPL